MSRPDRPFRATRVLANRTVHHDYATKEERDAATCTEDKRTTVTSRKPVKPGTPVCWVNVYEDSDGKRAGGFTHRTEGAAALSAGSAAIHCIPVYLPGEGAEPACTSECDTLRAEVQDWASRFKQAQQEVERKHDTITVVVAQRDQAYAEVEQWKDAAEHAEGKLSEERMSSQAERKECDKLQAEVERLTYLAKDWETNARVRVEERDTALTESAQLRAKAELRENQLQSALNAAAAHKAEVERLTKELASLHLTCDEFKRQRDEARNGPTAQALAQAFANGQRKALADVRAALGIKEES